MYHFVIIIYQIEAGCRDSPANSAGARRVGGRTLCLTAVGVPGIEPGHHAPKACVLPVYDTPLVGLTLLLL